LEKEEGQKEKGGRREGGVSDSPMLRDCPKSPLAFLTAMCRREEPRRRKGERKKEK